MPKSIEVSFRQLLESKDEKTLRKALYDLSRAIGSLPPYTSDATRAQLQQILSINTEKSLDIDTAKAVTALMAYGVLSGQKHSSDYGKPEQSLLKHARDQVLLGLFDDVASKKDDLKLRDGLTRTELIQKFGVTEEELEMIIRPILLDGKQDQDVVEDLLITEQHDDECEERIVLTGRGFEEAQFLAAERESNDIEEGEGSIRPTYAEDAESSTIVMSDHEWFNLSRSWRNGHKSGNGR